MLKTSDVTVLDNVKIKLTPYQLIFYYEWLQNPFRSDYNIVIDNNISGEINFEKFDGCFVKIANELFILSHNIKNADGIYWQPRKPCESVVIFHQNSLTDQEIYKIISAPFDLENDMYMRIHLIKLAENKYRMIFIFPHVVVDGVSTEEMWERLRKNYNDIFYESPTLIEQRILHNKLTNYFEEILEQHQDTIQTFWQAHLKDIAGIDLAFLQKKQPAASIARRVIDEHLFSFDQEVYAQVKRLKYQYKITPYLLGQMVLAILFHKLTDKKELALAYPIAFTEAKEVMYGSHINTMLIDYRFDDKTTLQTLIDYALNFFKDLKKSKAKYLPVNEIVRYADNPNVLDVAFAQTFFRDHSTGFKGIKDDSVNHDFHIDLVSKLLFEQEEHNNRINYRVRFDQNILDADAVHQFVGLYQKLFDQVLKLLSEGMADKAIKDLSLLDRQQTDLFVRQWNTTYQDKFINQTIIQHVEELALNYPERIAIVYKEIKISYGELNVQVNLLAHYLKKNFQLKPDDVIGLYMDRSEQMIIAMLAVLKAGAAYVPISPTAPIDRVAFIIKDTATKVILTDEIYQELLSHLEEVLIFKVVTINSTFTDTLAEHYSTDNLLSEVLPENLAYIIYTSGSTGTPKGVMIEHSGLMNLSKMQGALFGLSDISLQQNCLWYSDYVFDAHVSEVYTALVNGHSLFILEEEKRLDFQALRQYIQVNNIQIATIPPVLLDKELLLDLDRLVVAGDVTHPQIMEKYRRSGVTIINAYGPTEASVCSSLHSYQIGDSYANVGRPLSNVTCYILNQYLEPLPIGVTGMLYIGGVGIARGYLNNRVLTEQSFITNPFQTDEDKARNYNARLYKTGDLARYTKSGDIEYIGRNDFQVKIRGFRIELEEIESKLLTHPAVEKALVIVKHNATSETKYLVAYYVAKQELDRIELANYLAQLLPDYMVPNVFIFISQFPLLLSGKIDRKALPEPELTDSSHYVAPITATEKKLCLLFASVLGLPETQLSTEDDFFQLGGDSIIGIQLLSRIRQQLGVNIGVNDIFNCRTIKVLANKISVDQDNSQLTPIESEQGLLEGEVDLLPIQQWFFNKVQQGVFKSPNHWNQSFALQLPYLDKNVLQQSLQKLAEYHDAFRLYYLTHEQQQNGVKQLYSDSVVSVPVEFFILDDISKVELDSRINNLQMSLNINQPPLYRVLCITNKDEKCIGLYFIMHHLIIDAVSWRIIRDDLQAIYHSLSENGEVICEEILGRKGSSYRQWSRAIASYKQEDRRALEIEKDYWLSIVNKVPSTNAVLEKFIEPTVTEQVLVIDRELTKQLTRHVHAVYNTQVNDILLTALGLALTKLTAQSEHAISLEGHGREAISSALDVSSTVGWFTTLYPVLLSVEPNDITTTLINIKEYIRGIPSNGIGYGALIGYIDYPLPTVSFNYLGQFEGTSEVDSWSFLNNTHTGLQTARDNKETNRLVMNGAIVEGELQFFISGYLSPQLLQNFASYYQQYLTKLIDSLLTVNRTFLTVSDTHYKLTQQLLNTLQLEHEVEAIFLANSLQQGFIYHAISQGDEDEAYRSQLLWDYHSPLDEAKLRLAWQLAQQKYPALRLRFSWDETLLQIVDKEGKVNWHFVDVAHLDEPAQQATFKQLLAQDKQEVYDLTKGNLFRIYLIKYSDNFYRCIFNNHHAILDGWSNPLLLGFVHDTYLKLLTDTSPQLIEDTCYLKAQDYLQTYKYTNQSYWQNYLKIAQDKEQENLSALFKLEQRQVILSDYKEVKEPQEETVTIAKDNYFAMKSFCASNGITVNALLQYLWHKLLSLYSASDVTTVGMTVAGRSLPVVGVEESVGLYINTLPIVLKHTNDEVVSLIKQLQQAINEANNRSNVDLVSLQKSGERLFNTLFVYENYPMPEDISQGDKLSITFDKAIEKQDYPLVLTVHENKQQVGIKVQYAGELFDHLAIAGLMARFSLLLQQMLTKPTIKGYEFNYLSADEYQRFIVQRNTTRKKVDKEPTLTSIFAKQVALHPERIAVKYQSNSLTYQQLDAKSTYLAMYLKEHYQLTANDLVALGLSRSEYQLVAILAVLKAGAAYVPMDPAVADERLSYMVKDINAKIVLTDLANHANLYNILPSKATVLAINDTAFEQELANHYKDQLLVDDTVANDLAYIIYTSGTTGQPKGVMVEHRNVVNLFSCSDELYRFNCDDVWTLFHSYTFDFSVWEMWGALLYGGQLVVINQDTIKDPDLFYDLCVREGVTVLNQTPSAFYQFISVAQDKAERLSALRYVIFGGEALNFSQLRAWYALYKDSAPYLINMYGITETTVHVTYKKLAANDLGVASLIGATLPNYTSYILDTSLRPVPTGVIGELYIGGNGVARGYLNNSQLTSERFISNPFQTEEEEYQAYNDRLYKTGDLGRLLPDGGIEYIGRADFQVKIRGFRIELGEIEAKLSSYQGIEKSVVLVNEHAGNKILVAYYVATQPLIEEDLVSYLQHYLPSYMIPTAFIAMEEFPLTVNGKLDRKKMPSPVLTEDYNYIPPSVGIEISLCNIFADILGIEADVIGIEDDFFKLGGDSISSIQLINRVRQQLNVKLSVKDVFAARTVKELARKITNHEQVSILTEQGLLTDKVGLLPIQSWFFKQVERGLYKEPNHWNQSVVINTPLLDTSLLQSAITLLVAYHDALRLVYKATNSGYEQYYQGEIVAIHFTEVTIGDYPTIEALNQLFTSWQNNFDIEQGKLYHIGYLADEANGCAKLHLALHHLIVDAVSLRLIKDNLYAIYHYLVQYPEQIARVTAEQILGNKGTSYRQWGEALDIYAVSIKEQVSYWQAIATESMAIIKQLATKEVEESSVVYIKLSQIATNQLLRDVHAIYHTQINEVLLTALVLSLDETLQLGKYPILLEGHGREGIADNLDINRTVGWFTSFYPVLLEVVDNERKTLLVTIKDQLNKIPDHGLGYGCLIGYCDVELPKIAFNYLGNFTHNGIDAWSFSSQEAGIAVSENNKSDLLLNINGMVIDNVLSFSIEGKLAKAQLAEIAKNYQKHLQGLCDELVALNRSYLTLSDVSYIISPELLTKLQSDKEVEAIFKANSLQQGFVYHALTQGDKDEAYRTQMVWEYQCEINSQLLKQAWILAQEHYPTLRLRFSWEEDIVQVIDKHSLLTWTNLDLTMLDESAQQQKIAELVTQDKSKAYDLSKSGLFRITLIKRAKDQFTCIFNNHHAILDGWSNPLLILFVHNTYLKLLEGHKLEVGVDKSYLRAQAYLQQHSQNDSQFWDDYLAQIEDSEDLTALLKPELRHLTLADYKYIKVPQELDLTITDKDYRALKDFCLQQGVTLNVLLQYIWHKQLSLYANSQTTVLGMTIAGRNLPIEGIEESVGLYINTLPVILKHSDQAVVVKLVELQNTINEVNNRSYVQLVKLQKGGQRLFNSLFIFENYPTPDDKEENKLRLNFKSIQEKMDYPLAVTAYETDQQIIFKLRYAGELFSEQTISELLAGTNHLLKQLMVNPYIKENNFSYLTAAMHNKMLVEWNNTVAAYPNHKTIIDIFAEQVAINSEAIAIKWQDISLTYRQLDEQTNLLAHYLKANYEIEPDDLVTMCLDRSHSILIALLAILKAGGAYVPVDTHVPDERFTYILEQTNSKVVITDLANASKFTSVLADKIAVEIIDKEEFWENLEENYLSLPLVTDVKPTHLAYVLFTSGTTGNPKGVMIEQCAYINLIYHYRNNYFASQDRVNTFSITNYVFDIWGLEYGLSLFTGGFIELANTDFSAIETVPYSFIQMTPSVWSACIDKITFNNPDLYIMVGGEPVTPQLLDRFFTSHQLAAVLNVYGPTETTIWSTTQVNTATDYDTSIGRPISNTSIYVLNAYNQAVPVGVLGELHIGGDGVARGYLNNQQLTSKSFINNPYQSIQDKNQSYNARLYKTGDLVRYLPDGRLEFIGRNDFQVKIRGFRIELGEIETRIASHPAVKQTVVVAKEHSSGNKYLVAYYVADEIIIEQEMTDYLNQTLPDYMIPAVFIRLTAFPLTASGKVNRKALPDAEFINEIKHYVAPETSLQRKLCELFAEVLGLESTNLSIEDNFFSLGGDSILVIKLVNKVNKAQLGALQLVDVFNHPTVKMLANKLQVKDQQVLVNISVEQTIDSPKYPVLSFAQERLWFIEQYERGSNAYNIPMVFRIKDQVNIKSLQLALQTVVSRHEVLRSLIKENDQGEGYQEVLDYPLVIRSNQVVSKISLNNELEKDVNHIFNLATEYPIRASLYLLQDSYYMSIVVHHIAFDGWSTDIFISELLNHYYYFEAIAVDANKTAESYKLPKLGLQYKDYALWQRKHLRGEYLNQQQAYWINQLADFETLNLPTDKARPPQVNYQGNYLMFELDSKLSADLHQLAKRLGVTLYSVLLTAYYLLLSIYSNQKDIVIGTPIANRNYSNIANLIGFFVNTLALRQQVDKTLSVKSFINKVSQAITEAQLYQDLPFERLVDELKIAKDASRHPIFQVTFGMESFGKEQLSEIERLFEPYQDNSLKIAKFDLSLIVKDLDGLLSVTFNYATALFNEVTIESFMQTYKELLSQFANIQLLDTPLKQLDYISKEQFTKIIYDWNATDHPYPESQTLIGLFELKVAEHPQRKAIVCGEQFLSYNDLNKQANRLAHYLMQNSNAQPNGIIGLYLDRSLEMVICMLAVLKTGAAYAPIDPAAPKERVAHIIAETNPPLVLTNSHYADLLTDIAHASSTIIDIDNKQLQRDLMSHSAENLNLIISAKQLAYVIYTSGTTGVPKGVMIEHTSAVNFIMAASYQLSMSYNDTEQKKCLWISNYVFDAHIYDVYATLVHGNCLYILVGEQRTDLLKIKGLVEHLQVDFGYIPPVLLDKENIVPLKKLIVAGEVTNAEVVESYIKQGIEVFNLYGPTEISVGSHFHKFEINDKNTNIGRTIFNDRSYIVDEYMKLLPIGAIGEIYIGGVGVSRGYLNNPELTAERFLVNPLQTRQEKQQGINQRVYKTGDLAKYLANGDIEYIGRNDFQVKIRGLRIELGEIESRLATYTTIQKVAVLTKQFPSGESYLVAYYVADHEIEKDLLNHYLSQYLPDYMLPSSYVYMQDFPYTMNGKLDRRKLPEPILSDERQLAEPVDAIEQKLRELFSSVLKLQADKISVEDSFFELGGNSILVIKLANLAHKAFDRELPVAAIFMHKTIRRLAAYWENDQVPTRATITPVIVTTPEQQLLSYAQQRLWFIEQLQGESSAYNVPILLQLKEDTDVDIFISALLSIVHRHEVLHSVIKKNNSTEGYQQVIDYQKNPLVIDEVNVLNQQGLKQQVAIATRHLFKLDSEYPIKISLYRLANERYISIVVHHIAFDGWSADILVKEIYQYYRYHQALKKQDEMQIANYLPVPLAIQYKDYALWQRQYLSSETAKQQLIFWKNKLVDYRPLALPLDKSRPYQMDYKGENLTFSLTKQVSNDLRLVARRLDVSLYSLLLSGYYLLLRVYSNQDDIVIGTPVANRNHTEVEGLVGFFVNSLALRQKIDKEQTLISFIKEIGESLAEAQRYQDLPFDLLVNELHLEQDASKNPIFQVMFSLQSFGLTKQNAIDELLTVYNVEDFLEQSVAKFDLTTMMDDSQDIIQGVFNYASSIFSQQTMNSYITTYKVILEQLALLVNSEQNSQKISELSYIDISTDTNKVSTEAEIDWSQFEL